MSDVPKSEDPTLNREVPAGEDATRRRAVTAPATLLRPESQATLTRLRTTAHGNPPREPTLTTALQPGMLIRRRYELVSLIGAGGMGQVWKAKDRLREQARDPDPFVALKLLNANFADDPDALTALQRETHKSQELAHPNIISVHDFDIDDAGSGHAFMSMELLQGETCDSLIRDHERGLPRQEALPLIVGMARGLEYAHNNNIVHSDFKPGNVFVTLAGTPKILDFGIARAATVVGVERHYDPFDAGILGGLTLAYASPGMIERAPAQPADDVYALGLVAYELLTGTSPFDRRGALEAQAEGLTPARIKSLRRYEWRAIARALEFDATKRWRNAGEFLRAFEGKSVLAAGLAAVALVLAVATGIFAYQANRAAGPSIPFEALSAADQAAFRTHLANGDGEWRLVTQGYGDQSLEAAHEYAAAYAVHPRNPEAAAALQKSADYIVERLAQVPDRTQRLKELKSLQGYSEFYTTYAPLARAIARAEGAE